jgi:hypothetical protein
MPITTLEDFTMGHFIFCILHFLAFLFGFIGLFITIPLHIIYGAVRTKRPKMIIPMSEYEKHISGAFDRAIEAEKKAAMESN